MRTPAKIVAIAMACAALGGCPSSSVPADAGKTGAAGHGAVTDGGALDGGADDDAGMVACPVGSIDGTTFVDDMQVVGNNGKITGRLVKADPLVPERYNNQWTMEFTNADGTALDDVDLAKVFVTMPYHPKHGKPAYRVAKASEAGRFEVGINLFMRGYFEVQFTVSSPTAGDDTVVFTYCVRD
jgi:hypothetical protein